MKIIELLIFFQEHRLCIWFKDDIPHFNIDGNVYIKGIVEMNTEIQYTGKEDEIIDYLLCNYKTCRTILRYPFLIYPTFIWKEGIIYTKTIPSQYVIYDKTTYGPIYCDICKKYYLNPYYSYMYNFCKRCKESVDNIYITK
jgi:hypothetical protein